MGTPLKVIKEEEASLEKTVEEAKTLILKAAEYFKEGCELLDQLEQNAPHYNVYHELLKSLHPNYELPCQHFGTTPSSQNYCQAKKQPDGFPRSACIGCETYVPGHVSGHPRRGALRVIADFLTQRVAHEGALFKLKIEYKK